MQSAKPVGPRVENARAVILGLHGFNDYSNAFSEPAAYWATQGIITYAYDQRGFGGAPFHGRWARSEEHTSELQSLMRISYAVFCLKKKKKHNQDPNRHIHCIT